MKKKLLHIALATALLPVFTGCIGNFEEYNTNPYEPHKLDPPLLFTQMITDRHQCAAKRQPDDRPDGGRPLWWLSDDVHFVGRV